MSSNSRHVLQTPHSRSFPCPSPVFVFCGRSQIREQPEPNLALLLSALRLIRHEEAAYTLLLELTAPSLAVATPEHLQMAAARLKGGPPFALRKLAVVPKLCLDPRLLSALAATTSLESFHIKPESEFYDEEELKLSRKDAARLAPHLKAVKSLRDVDLRRFPADECLELLKSRTNWTRIQMPTDSTALARATEFAPHNRCDFALEFEDLESSEHLRPWLLNPHLTSLRAVDNHDIAGVFDELQSCKNLTCLVCTSPIRVWRIALLFNSHVFRMCGTGCLVPAVHNICPALWSTSTPNRLRNS
jgi:hypothetical protein